MPSQDDGGTPKLSIWDRLRLTWLFKEPDAAVALILAVGAGVADAIPGLPTDVKAQIASSGVLILLALLAVILMRDRNRGEPIEKQLTELLTSSADVLKQLPDRFDQTTELITRAQQVLDDATVITLLDGKDVRSEHEAARRGTDRWFFKGGTGTFIRAVTLPECVANARNGGRRPLRVRLEIIDPENPTVCEAYARFRQSITTAPNSDTWSPERTRKEAYATILAACWYRKRYQPLTIEVGLSPTMTTWRWDMSASRVIVTRDDPMAPALVAPNDKLYYAWCDTELSTSFDQTRHVPIDRALTLPLGDEPSVEEVRGLFSALGLPLPGTYGLKEIADITQRALKAADPYH
jgi:hypothetical protein